MTNGHPGDREIQLYLDGEGTTAERWETASHLNECAECTNRLDEYRMQKEEIASLPRYVEPPRDLWPAIAARIEQPAVPTSIRRMPRRSAFRLIATGIAAMGGAAVLMIGIGLGRQSPHRTTPLSTIPSVPTGLLATYDEPSYDSAIAELELALSTFRDALRPETVAALEESLSTIDAAIADARAALAADPANDHLHRHLAASMQTKLRLLRTMVGTATAEI